MFKKIALNSLFISILGAIALMVWNKGNWPFGYYSFFIYLISNLLIMYVVKRIFKRQKNNIEPK